MFNEPLICPPWYSPFDLTSIITAPQSSSLFSINNGTIYSLIRLRVVDACSNAGLKDESVLPLANFIVSSDSVECFEHKLTLRVDSIPNTEYTWYKRIPVNDSIVVGTGVSYTITTLLPQDTGRYFCKIVLNSGCLIKFANYVVTGSCGLILPNAITLSGSKVADGNRLYWNTADDGANKYEIERSINNQAVFSKIGTVSASGQNSHNFLDINPVMGSNLYRIKISYTGNIFRYSNVVNVRITKLNISIYPNPVGNELYVTINSNSAKKYKIETFTMAGQQIFSKYASGQDIFTRFPRTPTMGSGLYNLVVTDLETNEKNFFKVIYR